MGKLLLDGPPDATKCTGCRHLRTDEDDGPWCRLHRKAPLELELCPPIQLRIPECVASESAARAQEEEIGRLRKAIRAYLDAWDDWCKSDSPTTSAELAGSREDLRAVLGKEGAG